MRFHSSWLSCFAFFIAFLAVDARAQFSSPILTLNLGLIETLDRDLGDSGFTLYPEMEARAAILRSESTGLSLSGGLYAGGWRDAGTPAGCRDCITYSYTSVLLGARVAVSLDRFPLPILFRGGLSRHFVFAEYLSGATLSAADPDEYRDTYYAAEAGVRLQVPVTGRLQVGGDAGFHIPMPISSTNRRAARLQFSVATTYKLE